jgi:hypothetical protein
MAKAEIVFHHASQFSIEHTKYDRYLFPAITEGLAYGQPCLYVGQVGTCEDGHS